MKIYINIWEKKYFLAPNKKKQLKIVNKLIKFGLEIMQIILSYKK